MTFLLEEEMELEMSPSGNLGRSGVNPSSRELTPSGEGWDTNWEGGITEFQRRDKDLGQAGQMPPLTPRGDSADYQAAPELLPQHNVCL